MRLIGKILLLIIIGMLLGASAYVIVFTGDKDTEPPQIDNITGNLTVTAGQTATISAIFTDDVNVTVATLYYKAADVADWRSTSILNGSTTLDIPSSATSNYYYYITADDAAGNGPVGDPSMDGSRYYTITVNPGGGNPGNETLIHTVFIEEATATWCNNCPNVANILHTLYESHNYRFYYISLINATNTQTADRLFKEYNVFGFPTVFIDGGYSVIMGGDNPESAYTAAITAAQARTVPKIKVTITAQYSNTTQEVTVHALVENKGNDTYSGQLKLYLTEIVSHLTGYDSKPFSYGFLEYLMINDVSVDGNKNLTFSETKDISAYDYENLMIVGVVFSSEKQQGYAQPPSKNPFDAHYADATNATKIVEKGNLPPQLQITSPLKGKIYLNGKPRLERLQQRKLIGLILNNYLHNTTVLLGKKIVTVNASDDSAVAKVEFSIDGVVMSNDTQAPYEFSFTKLKTLKSFFLKKHMLTVTVYDDTGKKTSSSIVFKSRI